MKCEKASATVLPNDGQKPLTPDQNGPQKPPYHSLFDLQE